MADEVQFQTSTATVVRGFENRTIAKWESDGWELVSRNPGALRTELTFRRPKPKPPWKLLAMLGAAVVVVLVATAIGNSLSGGDEIESAAVQGSSAPAATSTPTGAAEVPEPSSETEEIPPATDAVAAPEPTLTPDSNSDLAALLTGPDSGPSVERFAETYSGQIIEFDGRIGAIANHGDYDTRFDILVSYGDYSETISSGGPSFQFRDVNTTSDLHYVGDVPDSIGRGDNIRVTARVLEFDSSRLLFQLEPVATRFR